MPKPERNQPCLCGSGKKYKHCCYAAEGLEREMPEFSMLLHVLGTLRVRQFSILPFAHMNLEELDFVAMEWQRSGHAREAMKLLEGLFNSGVALDERTEPVFHCLVDCYDRLDNPLKKKRLLERGMAAKDSYFRASSMQRMCSILADRGEYAEAWRLFGEAQRLQPDDPSLAHLEIAMLKNQGEDARAKSCAEFWIARLSRDKSGEYDNLIQFLRGAADDLDGSMQDMMREDLPALDAFARLAGNIPQPACHYHLQDMDGSAGSLEPDVRLKKLHQSWRRPSTGLQEENGILWHLPQPWLGWLHKEPLAWQSFDVLFDLMEGLEYSSPSLAGMEGKTVLPILRHAEALLHKVIETNRVDGLKLEWSWHENRPALVRLKNCR